MNWQYPNTEACAWLDKYIQDSLVGPRGAEYLDSLQVEECYAQEFADPPCLRLVEAHSDCTREVTVRVAGIICSKTLPPIHRLRRSHSAERVRYLRQFVRLTGLGSEAFEASYHQFAAVTDKLRAVEGVQEVEDLAFGLYEGGYCIDLHTRYLTERRLAPGQTPIPFTSDVDPNCTLERARGSKFVRITDNVVQYLQASTNSVGTERYEFLAPSEFKEGDVVETTGSFIAYPTSVKGKYKAVFVLRSVTMICSEFRERSQIPTDDVAFVQPPAKRPRHRKVLPSCTTLVRTYLPYEEENHEAGSVDVAMEGGSK